MNNQPIERYSDSDILNFLCVEKPEITRKQWSLAKGAPKHMDAAVTWLIQINFESDEGYNHGEDEDFRLAVIQLMENIDWKPPTWEDFEKCL